MNEFDKYNLKNILIYIKEEFGIWCFKDKRFIWMLANLSPQYGKEKMKTFTNLDDYGLLMKIINNCNSSLDEKNKVINEALKRNELCKIDEDGKDLNDLIEVLDYFNPNNPLSKFSNPIIVQNQPEYFKKIITDSKNIIDLELIHCKSGNFWMGSPEEELGRMENETQHKVTLTQDFLLAKYITTESMSLKTFKVYDVNSDEFNNLPPYEKDNYPIFYEAYLKKKDSLIPTSYSRDTALDFCNELNVKFAFSLPAGYAFTLPTEAQWEYACRAGTLTALYNCKDLSTTKGKCKNLDDIAWYQGNTDADIEFHVVGSSYNVGQKAPNHWGFYDMLGNLWEYCFDLYKEYPKTEMIDPCLEVIDDNGYNDIPFVCRGGSFVNDAREIRSASRLQQIGCWVTPNIGMRIALAPIHKSSGKDVRYYLKKDR